MSTLRRSTLVIITALALALITGCGETSDDDGAAPQATSAERSGKFTLAISSNLGLKTLPTYMTVEAVNELGYDLEIVNMDSSAEMQAASSGAIDITSASMPTQLAALDAGLGNKVFLTRYLNPFVLVAKNEITTCDQLDGRPMAIHANHDITVILTERWMTEDCTEEISPNYQIVSGGNNRISALMQGATDSSSIDLEDAMRLLDQAPGRFHILSNFAEKYPIVGGAYSASPEFLEENEQFVKDFIEAHLDVWEKIAGDPDWFIEQALAAFPDKAPAPLTAAAEAYLEAGMYPTNGGLDMDRIEETVEFAEPEGGYGTIKGPDDVVDRGLLDEVLESR